LVLLWGVRGSWRRQVKPGDDGADRNPEAKEIALSVPGHDLAEEHHREDRDDQTYELALQVNDVVNQQPAGSGHSGTQWVARFLARDLQ
jgi:hypothetical protein